MGLAMSSLSVLLLCVQPAGRARRRTPRPCSCPTRWPARCASALAGALVAAERPRAAADRPGRRRAGPADARRRAGRRGAGRPGPPPCAARAHRARAGATPLTGARQPWRRPAAVGPSRRRRWLAASRSAAAASPTGRPDAARVAARRRPGRHAVGWRAMAYLDHAATTPMLPEAVEAYVAALRDVGNASSLHAAGRRARRRGRGGPGAGRRRARRPAVRGDLHRRRHRERQPRGQGHLLGPPRPPTRAAPGCSPARSSTTPCSTRSSGSAGTRAPRSSWLPVDALGRVDVDALRGRARPRTATRSRWSPRCGPTTRSARCSRSPSWPRSPPSTGVPFHTDAIQAIGQVPVDFAASRRGRADRHRAQARRPGRRRRAAARPRRRPARRCCTAAARSATSAPARSTWPAIAALRGRGRDGGRRPSRSSRPGSRRCATSWSPGCGRRCRTRCSTATRSTGCPATRTSPSPAARATRCCCCSTRRASPARPGRPARPGVAQPSHVLLAMGADEDARPVDAAVHPRPHLDRGRRRRAGRGAAGARSSGPAGPARAAEAARASRRSLIGGRRPGEAGRCGCWPPCRAASTRRSRPPGRSTPATT